MKAESRGQWNRTEAERKGQRESRKEMTVGKKAER